MSILIKGVEMPKDGCHHTICIYADGTVSTGGRAYMAIPVPKHGRLIDADAFEKQNAYFWNRDFINPKYSETLADLVNATPTIIPAEED